MKPNYRMMIALAFVVGFVILLRTLVSLVETVFKACGIGQADPAGKQDLGEEIASRAPSKPIRIVRIRLWHVMIWVSCTSALFAGTIKASTMAARVNAFLAFFLVLAILVAVVYAVLVLYGFLRFYFRDYDPHVARVLKRADRGDVEGAIIELKQIIEERGLTGIRANSLGHFFGLQGKWQESHKQYVEAERLGGRQAILLNNQGYALAKMGCVPEAIALMEEARALEPENSTVVSSYCVMLADLGRFDEAAEQLRILEPLHVYYARSAKPAFKAAVEQLRQRIEAGLAAAAPIYPASASDRPGRAADTSH